MIDKKLKSGRKVKIKELSVDQIDDLKDIPELIFDKFGNTKTIKNINKARTAWIRAGLVGGDFKGEWKQDGLAPPDNILKELTDDEKDNLSQVIQGAQVLGK
tara:strand:+ start:502 stop:807 length:306 start_codon:yes stop_codon:yes gene_type:complete